MEQRTARLSQKDKRDTDQRDDLDLDGQGKT